MKTIKQVISNPQWFLAFWISLYAAKFLTGNGDDATFAQAFEQYGSFIHWAEFYAVNWGGRVVPHGLLVLLLQLPNFVFKLCNSIMLMLLAYIFAELFLDEKVKESKIYPFTFVWMVLTMLPIDVLGGTINWKCATVLYLWGGVAALFALSPMVKVLQRKQVTKKDFAWAYLGAAYAGGFEQVAAFMTVFAVIIFIVICVQNGRIQLSYSLLTGFICFATVFFCIILPGNRNRAASSVLQFMPNFDMYSLPEKLLWGIVLAIQGILNEGCLTVLLISGIVTFLCFTQKEGWLLKVGAVCNASYFFLAYAKMKEFLGWRITHALSPIFQLVKIDNGEFEFPVSSLATTFLAFIMIAVLGYLIFNAGREQNGFLIFLLYFGGIGTVMMMGFSPTIYASGLRTEFYLLLFLLMTLIWIASMAYHRIMVMLQCHGK